MALDLFALITFCISYIYNANIRCYGQYFVILYHFFHLDAYFLQETLIRWMLLNIFLSISAQLVETYLHTCRVTCREKVILKSTISERLSTKAHDIFQVFTYKKEKQSKPMLHSQLKT